MIFFDIFPKIIETEILKANRSLPINLSFNPIFRNCLFEKLSSHESYAKLKNILTTKQLVDKIFEY